VCCGFFFSSFRIEKYAFHDVNIDATSQSFILLYCEISIAY